MAFGVLLDTMLVRSVLVTALTVDVGRWMWWPGALCKHRDDPQPSVDRAGVEPVLTASRRAAPTSAIRTPCAADVGGRSGLAGTGNPVIGR